MTAFLRSLSPSIQLINHPIYQLTNPHEPWWTITSQYIPYDFGSFIPNKSATSTPWMCIWGVPVEPWQLPGHGGDALRRGAQGGNPHPAIWGRWVAGLATPRVDTPPASSRGFWWSRNVSAVVNNGEWLKNWLNGGNGGSIMAGRNSGSVTY